MRSPSTVVATLVTLTCLTPMAAHAQTILETETARPLRARTFEIGTGYELQTAREGKEIAVPIAFEYGLTNRAELLIEPVPYTSIRPKAGRPTTGPGDLELTLVYLARHETRRMPALAVAAELKVPTARNSLIGTGKTDYTGYVIASKLFGRLDTHANLGYTIVGVPAGTQLSNILNYAVAGEFELTRTTELFGEVLGNTTAGAEAGDAPGTGAVVVVPEASAGELVGTIGIARKVSSALRLSIGLSYDNSSALQVRPGITLWF